MRFLSCALAFVLGLTPAYSQSPPPSVKGQDQSGSYLPKPNLVVPHRQATNLGGLNVLLETGNKNILVNPGFESSVAGDGWTTVNGTAAIETTEVREGKRAYRNNFTSVNGILVQQEVTPTQKVTGSNYEFSGWVYTTAASTEFCSLIDGAVIQCVVIPQNTWTPVVLTAPAVDGDAHGVRVRTTASVSGTIYLDDVYVGPARNIGTVAQAQVLVRASRTTSQSIADATSTIIQFNSAGGDQANLFDTSTYRFNTPSAGNYVFAGSVAMAATTASGEVRIDFRKNGSVTRYQIVATKSGATSVFSGGTYYFSDSLVAGDYIEIAIYQTNSDTASRNLLGNDTAPGLTSLVVTRYPAPSQVIATANLPSSPTVTRLTSGSGTYTVPVGVKWLEVEMIGGGGGGQTGAAPSWGTGGGTGGTTTFGSSLLTATGGAGGNIFGGSGGSATVNSPAINVASVSGTRGGSGQFRSINTIELVSGQGGGSGGGPPVVGANPGNAGVTGTGGGGGGGGLSPATTTGTCGAGGGSGAYVKARIPSPAASYAYAVGAGGAGGTGDLTDGGAGGSGIIIITEHYNTDNMPLYVGSVATSSSGTTRIESANISCATASSFTSTTGPWLSLGNYSSGSCVMTMSGFSATPSCTANAGGTSTATTVAIKVQMTSATAATLTCISNNAGTTAACGDPWTGTVTCIGPK